MDQNPYAAPSVEVDADAPSARARNTELTPWFGVGTRKLLVMAVLTLGLYAVYWFERQYRFQKRALREATWPLARAIFSIFYAHQLFGRVEAAAVRLGVAQSWKSRSMGGIFVVSVIAGRVLSRTGDKLASPTGAVLALLGVASIVGIIYPVVQVQRTVNELLEREGGDFERNEHFTVWNWLQMALGGLVIALFLFAIALAALQIE